jgi:hypothetical protein
MFERLICAMRKSNNLVISGDGGQLADIVLGYCGVQIEERRPLIQAPDAVNISRNNMCNEKIK